MKQISPLQLALTHLVDNIVVIIDVVGIRQRILSCRLASLSSTRRRRSPLRRRQRRRCRCERCAQTLNGVRVLSTQLVELRLYLCNARPARCTICFVLGTLDRRDEMRHLDCCLALLHVALVRRLAEHNQCVVFDLLRRNALAAAGLDRHPNVTLIKGDVRDPAGGVNFDDISISIRPWPGGGLVSTRGKVYDHWALSTANLDATVARLTAKGVKFLEVIHPWGNSRAAMIEGPDRIAIELVEDGTSKAPATELASRVVDEALSRGLLLLKSGVHGNCIRVLVPLVISDSELDEALQVWDDALTAAL